MNKSNILKKCLCGVISGMLIMQCPVSAAKVNINIPAVTGFSLAGALALVCASLSIDNSMKDSKKESIDEVIARKDKEFKEKEKEFNKKYDNLFNKYLNRRVAMFYSDRKCMDMRQKELGVRYWYAQEITKGIENLFTKVGTGEKDKDEFFEYVKERMFWGTAPGSLIKYAGDDVIEICSSDGDKCEKTSKIQSECFDRDHINQMAEAIYNLYDNTGADLQRLEEIHDSFVNNGLLEYK